MKARDVSRHGWSLTETWRRQRKDPLAAPTNRPPAPTSASPRRDVTVCPSRRRRGLSVTGSVTTGHPRTVVMAGCQDTRDSRYRVPLRHCRGVCPDPTISAPPCLPSLSTSPARWRAGSPSKAPALASYSDARAGNGDTLCWTSVRAALCGVVRRCAHVTVTATAAPWHHRAADGSCSLAVWLSRNRRVRAPVPSVTRERGPGYRKRGWRDDRRVSDRAARVSNSCGTGSCRYRRPSTLVVCLRRSERC